MRRLWLVFVLRLNIEVECGIRDVEFKTHHKFGPLVLRIINNPSVLLWLLVPYRECEWSFTFTALEILDIQGFIIRFLSFLCFWCLFVSTI